VAEIRFVDALERIAESEDAVFALDANFLVILWNRGCERLLGRPAYQVLGRRCYDVLCGRDIYGNRYCGTGCPVAEQARFHPEETICAFEADVRSTAGASKRLRIATYRVPSPDPANATLVHVLRPPEEPPSLLEINLEQCIWEPHSSRRGPSQPAAEGNPLTLREHETLRRMGQGLSTDRIAREMSISPTTVRNHVAKILGKLGVHTKFAAVAHAYQNGLIDSEMSLLPVAHPDRPARGKGEQRGGQASPRDRRYPVRGASRSAERA
jgi:DNA-binding CsgD family transcriptional regulator